jgi:hypothetical protein
MFKAPFVCLAHNIFEEGVEDPLFTYANKAALELFEADWDTLIGLPSRNSAEPESQEVRAGGGPCMREATAANTGTRFQAAAAAAATVQSTQTACVLGMSQRQLPSAPSCHQRPPLFLLLLFLFSAAAEPQPNPAAGCQ